MQENWCIARAHIKKEEAIKKETGPLIIIPTHWEAPQFFAPESTSHVTKKATFITEAVSRLRLRRDGKGFDERRREEKRNCHHRLRLHHRRLMM